MQNRYDLLVPETLIPNSSNLNDYITPGHYYTPNAGASQTIQNTPYTTSGFKLIVENLSSTQHVLQTLKAANGKRIFYRTATIVSGSYQWSDWESPVTNADLPNVFTGTNLVTLNSPSQLTAPGFYYAEYMSNDVNANSGSNPMSDYSAGDFHMLLLAANANSTSGCRYGTLLVTSPRLTSSLWIGRIWDYQFTYWAKK